MTITTPKPTPPSTKPWRPAVVVPRKPQVRTGLTASLASNPTLAAMQREEHLRNACDAATDRMEAYARKAAWRQTTTANAAALLEAWFGLEPAVKASIAPGARHYVQRIFAQACEERNIAGTPGQETAWYKSLVREAETTHITEQPLPVEEESRAHTQAGPEFYERVAMQASQSPALQKLQGRAAQLVKEMLRLYPQSCADEGGREGCRIAFGQALENLGFTHLRQNSTIKKAYEHFHTAIKKAIRTLKG